MMFENLQLSSTSCHGESNYSPGTDTTSIKTTCDSTQKEQCKESDLEIPLHLLLPQTRKFLLGMAARYK